MKANIVLGLGYGDEGKGRVTDYLCSGGINTVVIRFSGGPQAAHTVKHLDGKKHVHSSFGSGALRGVPSYFSEHTTIYPLALANEFTVLKAKVPDTMMPTIHPLAMVTTPFDVWANRMDTKDKTNGTCGMGVGKTMTRHNYSPFKLYAIDLLYPELFIAKLDAIGRLFYNFSDYTEEGIEIMKDYTKSVQNLNWRIQDYEYLKKFENLIFEGSQGILLDMDHGQFPHVTFANTTSKNAHSILDKIKLSPELRETFYVTRCYSTRHGKGPFVEANLELQNTEEETNVLNEYQGHFKVGEINYKDIHRALEIDKCYTPKECSKNLVVTCLDQRKDFKFDYNRFSFMDKIYKAYSAETHKMHLD